MANLLSEAMSLARSLGIDLGQEGRPSGREPWVETSGSNIKAVDRRLTDILSRAAMELAATHPGYTVEGFSGKKGRASGTPNHPAGRAIDVNIIGPDGKALKNEKNGRTWSAYHEFAQIASRIQKESYPELTGKLAWGGNFRQGVSFDQMHFDLGGTRGAYGTIEGGLNPEGRAAMARIGYPDVPSQYAWDSSGIPLAPRTVDTAGIPGITPDTPEFNPSPRPGPAEAVAPMSGYASMVGLQGQRTPALQATDRLAGQQATDRLVGADVTPPEMPQMAMATPNRPDVANTEQDVQRLERQNGMFQPPDQSEVQELSKADAQFRSLPPDRPVPQGPVHQTAPAAPKEDRLGGLSTFSEPKTDRFSPAAPKQGRLSTLQPGDFIQPAERVNPIGYEIQSPMSAPEEHLSPIGAPVQSPLQANARVNPIGYELQAPAPSNAPSLAPLDQPDLAKSAMRGMMSGMMQAKRPEDQPQQTIKSPRTIRDYPVAEIPPAPQAQTFPAPPEPPSSIPDLIGRTLKGGLVGGIPGALAAAAFGGNSSASLVPQADQRNVGFGASAIDSAMNGGYGDTAYSRGMPGASVTSRGPNRGYDLVNSQGIPTHFDANGHIVATPYSGISLAGLLGFGGRSRRGYDKASNRVDNSYFSDHPGLY